MSTVELSRRRELLNLTAFGRHVVTSNPAIFANDHHDQLGRFATTDASKNINVAESPVVKNMLQAIMRVGGDPILVGGCIRDKLLGAESKDIDIEVFGLSADDLVRTL